MAQLKRRDPESPAALSVQLNYAEYLLSEAQGPCAERLEHAQEELGSADANPEVRVMFPGGWANVADLDYRVHLARAECSGADRKSELQAALVAARRAVDLYRDVFDYHSMVIMQFDAAVAQHQLGEDAEALKALETALDMDREYGFKDDAPENYKLLLSWRGEPDGDEQVAELMRDFPQRQAVLTFGWRPSDARVSVESHRVCLQDGQIVYRQMTACPVSSPSAATILVDIGYEDCAWEKPVPRGGDEPLVGILRKPDPKTFVTQPNKPAAKLWYWRDLPGMASALGAARPAALFVALEQGPQPFGCHLTRAPIPINLPNRHLEYALTWFGLAGALAGVYGAAVFKRMKG